jgi:hypothetical protein
MDADERLRLTVDRVSATLGELVEQLQVTEDELRAALGFLGEVSQAGQLPLLSDVLGVSVAVDDVTHGGHLDDDTIGAVKPELTGRLEKHDDLGQLSRRGVDRPFFTYAYDFAPIPATSKEGAGDGS